MFKQVLLLAAGFIAGAIAVNAIPSRAQPYLGLSAGSSNAILPESSKECGNCIQSEMHTRFPVYQAFAGYDFGLVAIEGGAGSLSGYRSHNIRTTGDIRQEIDTRDLYVRGLVFLSDGNLKPFASFGLARVSMKNHEYGWNDPSMKFVEQVNYDTRTRPIFGVGAMYRLSDRFSVRAEVTRITHVAVSHWTLEQNVNAAWLGLMVNL